MHRRSDVEFIRTSLYLWAVFIERAAAPACHRLGLQLQTCLFALSYMQAYSVLFYYQHTLSWTRTLRCAQYSFLCVVRLRHGLVWVLACQSGTAFLHSFVVVSHRDICAGYINAYTLKWGQINQACYNLYHFWAKRDCSMSYFWACKNA